MESNINVLLTSAGRRVALSSLLLKSIQDLIPHARLVTADQYPSLSAACRIIQDESILPNIREDNYADSLKALVDREAIGLVIPTIDPELNIYSKFKRNRHIEGTQFLISESSLIERCIEKQASELLFSEIGIQTPLQFSEWPGYPVFARPNEGSGSIHAQVVLSKMQFDWLKEDARNFVFTQYLNPETYSSYTIDLYYQKGQLISMVPRKRVEVRAGEISKGLTDKGLVHDIMLPKLRTLTGADGPIGVQIFMSDSGEVYGIEVNPRFCGGYPLTHASGAHFTEWLIRDKFLHEELSFFDGWEHNKMLLRYDADLFF